MVWYGQVVVGPPGSGKTTYCDGMSQMCRALKRPVVLVNLDPANDVVPYTADIDIKELVTVENIMSELSLGPNGSLLYAAEYLLANFDWLADKVKQYPGVTSP
eukprot:GHVN01077929.1.p3 GENE.GHVN01077929.1~~GHVN01077929.1.p3  ORF type:complete len:103 (-),score=11.24 GHVN01077929.1:379-687(-)